MPFTVTGAAELRATFAKMAAEVQRETLEAAALDGAHPILEEAIALVPVAHEPHKNRIMGALKESMGVKLMPRRSADTAVVAIGPLRKNIGLDPFYARWVEFGTPKMGAEPYLRPALLSRGIEAADRVRRNLWAAIMKHAV